MQMIVALHFNSLREVGDFINHSADSRGHDKEIKSEQMDTNSETRDK